MLQSSPPLGELEGALTMFKNYFKIAIRHLQQSKLYSIINILGLTAGITCTLLAILYWKDERSFDEFHKTNPNLYRITTNLRNTKEGNRITTATTGQVQAQAFKASVPEIKTYARILGGDIYTDLASESKRFHLRSLFVDSSFFQVFSFPFLKGNPATALQEINGVVLTESTARKFFNTTDVIGKL
ncbi:MAG: ABC transporter permease, partial [Chitinophagaceae bacterium]